MLFANGAIYQCCRHGRINAAGQGADDIGAAHLFADEFDLPVDERLWHPILLEPAQLHKLLQHVAAVFGLGDFQVELQTKNRFGSVLDGGDERALVAVTVKPGGAVRTWSPWLIQTVLPFTVAVKIRLGRASSRLARPYSQMADDSTLPPNN